MPPKKGKEPKEDENSWRRRIEESILNDARWSMKVVVIESAGNDQDRIYLNKYEGMALEERRYAVRNLSKTETIFMINQLGSEKKIKDDNLKVFEEGQAYLKEKQDIPPDIQALIIKHLIIKMREEYLIVKQQRLEVHEGLRRESATMLDKAEVRGTVGVKPPESPPPPPTSAKGKGKGEPDPSTLAPEPAPGKKYNTILRERGEEWRDKVYVDDYPVDGPNMYIAVTGFQDPFLPWALIKIGVPVSAVIQIRIDPIAVKVPSTLLRGTKRGQSQTELLAEQAIKFWEDLQQLRIHPESTEIFKNTAFVVYSPPYWDTEPVSGDPDKIYDEMCYLMYDIQDLTRQHQHYLHNMDIIEVPMDKEDMNLFKYYHGLIDDIPLECVTIYSLLDALLETACNHVNMGYNNNGINSRSSLSTAVTLNHPTSPQVKSNKPDDKGQKSVKLIKDVFNHLCQTEERQKSYRLTFGEEYEEHKDPIIIKYGDYAKYNNFHLGNLNLDNIVASTLLNMPINRLWSDQQRPELELEAKVNFHVNVLLSCFEREDVETSELKRLMHILACRKLYNNRSSIQRQHLGPTSIYELKKSFLKRSVLAEPLVKCPSFSIKGSSSFPSMTRSENVSEASMNPNSTDSEVSRIKFLFDCPDISELVSASEIASNHPLSHMIDDFELFEDFTDVSAQQIILDAFNKFNCVDYKYCEVTDCIVLMFFNSHDKDGISREKWRNHIPTPVCLQDFFDFDLDEHYEWVQKEEKSYDEQLMIKAQSEFQDLFDPFAARSCLGDTDVESDLLIEGSLKYQTLNQSEPISPSHTETETRRSLTSSPADIKSSAKSKGVAPPLKKIKHPSVDVHTSSSIPIMRKPFLGFDISDRRVEAVGKDSSFYSKDGTKVSTTYILLIPLNVEYVTLNISPGNGGNDFWVHKTVSEFSAPEDAETSESFRVSTKDQIMINVKKQIYEVIIPNPITPPNETSKAKLNNKPLQKEPSVMGKKTKGKDAKGIQDIPPLEEELPPITEKRSFHSLYVTWPNGQVTETVHVENSSDVSHVKQFFATPVPFMKDEEMRCISLTGDVISFKTSGVIEILRPSGVYLRINECHKMIDYPQTLITSEASSEKVKKGKEKEKPSAKKDKSAKTKAAVPEVDYAKLYGYVINLEEFEIIDTNGLRQKWTHDEQECENIEKLLIRTATDYCLGEIFSRRMDGTHTLLNKNGFHVVTFPDKTRIVSQFVIDDEEIFPEWTDLEKEYFEMNEDADISTTKISMSQKSNIDNESAASSFSKKIEEEEFFKEKPRQDGYISVHIIYTVENSYFATVTINKQKDTITVDSPNNTSVTVDSNNHYEISLDNGTTCASFDGHNLHISYESCARCKSSTHCNVQMNEKSKSEDDMTGLKDYWLKLKDSFCKKIVINEEGNISILDEPCSQEMIHEHVSHDQACEDFGFTEEAAKHDAEESLIIEDSSMKSAMKTDNSSVTVHSAHGQCREVYDAKAVRFFVLRRNLACSEIVHRTLVEQYKKACRWQPWCSINQYNSFGDHRSLLSLLSPMHITETEKWRMDSKLSDKPKYLTFKDLKPDSGKGFYHWMRPYERFEPKPMKPDNVLPPRLPRGFILRTLELQWGEEERENLKGARELSSAILKYRQVIAQDCETMIHVPIVDVRSESERLTDQLVQELGRSIYEDLKQHAADDVKSRARVTITTKPPLVPEDDLMEYEQEEGDNRSEEERQTMLEQLDEIEPMSVNLQRYWRRRAEELKEEEFYKYLLRESAIPPYFSGSNVGAIWWDLNQTLGNAVLTSERRRMRCDCEEEGSSKPADELLL